MRTTPTTIDLYHVTLPMRYAFDHLANARRRSDSIVLELTHEGISGLGECAPRSYVTGETADGVLAEAFALDLSGLARAMAEPDSRETLARLRTSGIERVTGITGGPNLKCLFELALIDYFCRRDAISIAEALTDDGEAGKLPRSLPFSQVKDLKSDAASFLSSEAPFHFVKVKASNRCEIDATTISTIRTTLGPDVPIAIDVNMAWSRDEAAIRIPELIDCGVDWFEEPLAKGDFAGCAALAARTGAKIMLDESLASLADARAALHEGACAAFNIRISKVGGLLPAMHLVDFARRYDVAFQIGVQVAEVGPLVSAGRHLGFQVPDALTLEAGQSDRFFETPVVTPFPVPDRSTNHVERPAGRGLGVSLTGAAAPYRLNARRQAV